MTARLARSRRVALAAVAIIAACGVRAHAQPAPYHDWRTLETSHFRVHVPAGLEREGRVAGAAAERAYGLLARELVEPRGPIELVVSDDADYSNGAATPYPSNRIFVFATPPVENEGLRLNEDWLALVVTHELTHIFHLDRSRGIWAVGQRIFGRAPGLFPNQYSPSWLTEGLAVYYESRLTAGGRLHDAEHRTLARAAALEDRLPALGDLSLGSSRFPGGEGAYAYGSLFVEYLSQTHGDSSIARFVERQSGALLPIFQERAARRAFGVRFTDAFDTWRDSVRQSSGTRRPPLPGWRELTTHAYYATNPRWLDDSTLVYTGSDGRETNAAYTVTTTGVRTRLGRRSSLGANVPLGDGRLLFAQPDYVATEEVRSDLYVERDGVQRRLTHGARLIQPDAGRDGSIVAVQLDAARSRLVLLDREGRQQRVLRDAGPDETWSEPRWSPDGRRIATIHRTHGGRESLEVLDGETAGSQPIVSGYTLLSAPSWARDGRSLLYVSEQSGTPDVYRADASLSPSGGTMSDAVRIGATATALLTPEISPNGKLIAAAELRADGYHLGVGTNVAVPTQDSMRTVASPSDPTIPAVDSQPLAAGSYREYAAARTLLPRYWLPVVEGAPGGGTRLGAITSGQDAVGRHAYGAYVALETSGRYSTGALSYRYAGLRRPFLDVHLSQDWTSQGRITDSTRSSLGILLKRTRDVSLAASFVRPRIRTYSSLSAGLGLERRRFATDPAGLLTALDASFGRDYTYPRAFAGAFWSNAQRPYLSISPEDGISAAFTVRERFRSGDLRRTASASVVGTAAGYRSLDLPGFAHHVLALRLAGGYADARASSALEVGGTSSASVDVAPGVTVGEGRRTFGVRGFPSASVYGTRAAAASLEYRAPLAASGSGLRNIPLFFDRSSVSAFADAGGASCASVPLYADICSPRGVIGHTIASVGAELGLSVAVLQYDAPELIRLGVAFPVAGRAVVNDTVTHVAPASVYVAFGYSF